MKGLHKSAILLIILATILIGGCGKPTIDSSTEESLKVSIEEVKNSLPPERHEEFEEAIKVVAFSGIDFSELWRMSEIDTGATERKMKEALNGKTGEEVIALAKQIQAEEEKRRKEKSIQLITLAEDLREEEDYDRALDKYKEALRIDPKNLALESKIAETERIIQDQEKAEEDRRNKIRQLIKEAKEFSKEEKFVEALNKYQEILILDEKSEVAADGIEETEQSINEYRVKKEYIGFVTLYDFEASTIDTYLEKKVPAVKFKLKNEGDKTLTEVKVIVYFKDKEGNTIAEEDFYPVLVSAYSFSSDNKPLKPGYIWQMEKGKWYTVKDAPSEWQVGNADAIIADIEFEE